MNRLDEIKTRINAFRVGESERGSQWEGGPGEDMDWLVAEIERLTPKIVGDHYRYFYFSFQSPLGAGSTILKQHKQVDGQPDNGFNVATAHEHLMGKFQMPVVVGQWYEVTKVRYDQWLAFCRGLGPAGADGVSLNIVQGGGEKSDKPAAVLKAVKEVPPTEKSGGAPETTTT
jgi:hypothetical protein